ncbi:hypothetical protein [Mesorhizobium sp. M1365]
MLFLDPDQPLSPTGHFASTDSLKAAMSGSNSFQIYAPPSACLAIGEH